MWRYYDGDETETSNLMKHLGMETFEMLSDLIIPYIIAFAVNKLDSMTDPTDSRCCHIKYHPVAFRP